MEDKQIENRSGCYYIGFLSQIIEKTQILLIMKSFGKVLRLRLTKDKSNDSCKGYGYVKIELSCSEKGFLLGCLASDPPLMVAPIKGPKHLGSEHTRLIRRYVMIDRLYIQLIRKEVLDFFAQFGTIEVDIAEFKKLETGAYSLRRLHLFYADQTAVQKLEKHSILQIRDFRISVFTGIQDLSFDELSRPYQVYDHIDKRMNIIDEKLTHNENLSKVSTKTIGINKKEKRNYWESQQSEASEESEGPGPAGDSVSRSKKRPKMIFDTKKLSCTINANQLKKYHNIFNIQHAPSNVRFNIRSPDDLQPFQ